MIIKDLTLSNFRRFTLFDISFDSKMTVIVARNGQGKTSILDAATVALGTFVGTFDMGRAKHFSVNDARYLRLPDSPESEQQYPVSVISSFDEPDISGTRVLSGKKNKTTIKDAKEITDYGKVLMQQIRDLDSVALPVVAYYGSGRLWNVHKNMSRKAVVSESRTLGYEDCLSPASNFKQVQQWMAKATYAMAQHQEMSEYSNYKFPGQIKGIKTVVDKMLNEEGWSRFHYSMIHEELTMYHDTYGILPVSLLSDGVRSMVSLVADLAWRCAKLNPQLGEEAPDKTQGIVFIDEVDLHLHPSWQQRIIENLQDAFPRIQFIVTTHSPQVLSTVPKECIRVLGSNTEGVTIAAVPKAFSYGEPSNDILQAIMHVDPQPPIPEKQELDLLTSLVDQGDYKSEIVGQLLCKLKQQLNENHPQIIKIERSIRRQVALSK
jgi:predicted ATP-binding protein involved in virulence